MALFAGGDLGWLARWNAQRHLAACARCRREVAEFSAVRSEITELGELPELPWNRLAAEMKANIRVGLAAGECVAPYTPPLDRFPGRRMLVAYASIVALVAAGLWLQHPMPTVTSRPPDGIWLRATDSAIELNEGGKVLRLMHTRATDPRDVIQSVGAQGSLRARYVDADTGYVTINNVYVQ